MFNLLLPVAADAGISGAAVLQVDWTILGPIVLNALATIGALAYTFGVVNQRINTLDRDLERVHKDVEIVREGGRKTEERIHEISLAVKEIATKMDLFISSTNNSNTCPYFGNTSSASVSHDAI